MRAVPDKQGTGRDGVAPIPPRDRYATRGACRRMMTTEPATHQPLGLGARRLILAAAFLAWLFAGLEISLFVLIHRPMMLSLLGGDIGEEVVASWFAWYQA